MGSSKQFVVDSFVLEAVRRFYGTFLYVPLCYAVFGAHFLAVRSCTFPRVMQCVAH